MAWDEIIAGLLRAAQLISAGDRNVIEITLLSLRVSGSATLIGAAMGIPLGSVLALYGFRGKAVAVGLVNTLTGLPPVLVGLFVYLLLSFRGPLGYLGILYTPEAMVFAQLILVVPVVAGVSYSSVSSIDPAVREVATSMGASSSQEILTVLKEARMGILTSLVVGFGAAISEVGAIMIVGGNIEHQTRALTTAMVLLTSRGEFAEGLALGIILLTMAFFVNLALTIFQQPPTREVSFWGRVKDVMAGGARRKEIRTRQGRGWSS